MNCECYPTLSYLLSDFVNINPDQHFLSQWYTFGILLGLGAGFFLWMTGKQTRWNPRKFFSQVLVPICIALLANLVFNFFFAESILSLSTVPFLCAFLIVAALITVNKSIVIFLLISLSLARFGCHFSGDGHWGKTVTADSWFYPIFKDCTYARNVNNHGKVNRATDLKYNRYLKKPKYPLGLIDGLSISLLALFFSLRKNSRIEQIGIAVCLYKYFSNSIILDIPFWDKSQLILLSSIVLLGIIYGTNFSKPVIEKR